MSNESTKKPAHVLIFDLLKRCYWSEGRPEELRKYVELLQSSKIPQSDRSEMQRELVEILAYGDFPAEGRDNSPSFDASTAFYKIRAVKNFLLVLQSLCLKDQCSS